MFSILTKKKLAPNICQLEIHAPEIARKARPGNFVVIRLDEKGERIPLTIADRDEARGTITLVVQEVGLTTSRLCALKIEDGIRDVLGPLGSPSELASFGTVVMVGGGVGIAEAYPVARALAKAGNKVIGIIGARERQLVIFENEMRSVCDTLYITTDDGSYGERGFVTDILKRLISGHDSQTTRPDPATGWVPRRMGAPEPRTKIDLVYAVGPLAMMKAVSQFTRPYGIKTRVSLNPIMVDATGMCGACRVTYKGKTHFGCVHGPEFDGHEVDFDELERRQAQFKEQENKAARQLHHR